MTASTGASNDAAETAAVAAGPASSSASTSLCHSKDNGVEENGGAVLPPTQMLYMTYEGNWQTECTSRVLSVSEVPPTDKDSKSAVVSVILDQTVLHAQGGGQPTDLGELVLLKTDDIDNDEKTGGLESKDEADTSIIKVEKVTLDRETGVATHTGRWVPTTATRTATLKRGDSVEVKVDVDRRCILSECHTAGHVVDSAMARCGKQHFKPSKAYHFLESPYVEYQGIVPPNERDSLLKQLQFAFCELVQENIDTKIELLSKEQADAVCNRQAQNFDVNVFADPQTQEVRVVTVAGYPCPCGGTHVKCTGDLKARNWGITGFKCKKDVIRVKYGQNVTVSSK